MAHKLPSNTIGVSTVTVREAVMRAFQRSSICSLCGLALEPGTTYELWASGDVAHAACIGKDR